jgi:hypothetical protein
MEEQYPPPSTAMVLEEIQAHFGDLCVPGAPMVPLYIWEQDPTVLWQQMPAIALAVDQGHDHVQRYVGDRPEGWMHVTGIWELGPCGYVRISYHAAKPSIPVCGLPF